MKMLQKKPAYFALAAILASLFSASLAFSGPWRGDCQAGECRQAKMEAMAEKLGLSDAQKDLLADHKAKQRESSEELRATVRETREAMKAELAKTDFDQATVERLHEQTKALKAEMADHRFAGMLELRQILTPEQFSEFMALKGEHRGHRGKKCGSGYRTDQ